MGTGRSGPEPHGRGDGQRDLSWPLGDVKPGGLIIPKGIKSEEGSEMTRGSGVGAAPLVTVGDLVNCWCI